MLVPFLIAPEISRSSGVVSHSVTMEFSRIVFTAFLWMSPSMHEYLPLPSRRSWVSMVPTRLERMELASDFASQSHSM